MNTRNQPSSANYTSQPARQAAPSSLGERPAGREVLRFPDPPVPENITVNFIPSSATRDLYLHLRGRRLSTPDNQPSLFGGADIGAYVLMVVAAIVMEGTAMFFSFDYGVEPPIILTAFFIDCFLAVCGSYLLGRVNRLELKISQADATSRGGLLSEQYWAKAYVIATHLGIAISQFVKIKLFNDIHPALDGVFIAVAGAYTIGGILHVLATGECFFRCRLKMALTFDRRRYNNTNGEVNAFDPTAPRCEFIEGPVRPVRSGRHTIEIDENGQAVLCVRGLLLDAQINDLVGEQTSNRARYAVAKACATAKISFIS